MPDAFAFHVSRCIVNEYINLYICIYIYILTHVYVIHAFGDQPF